MGFFVHDTQVAFEDGGLDGGTETKVEVVRGPGWGVEVSVVAKPFHEGLGFGAKASERLQDERDEGRVFSAGHGGVTGGLSGGIVLGGAKRAKGGGGAVGGGGGVDDSDVDEKDLSAKSNAEIAMAVVVPVVLARFEPRTPSCLGDEGMEDVDDVVVASDCEVTCLVDKAVPRVSVKVSAAVAVLGDGGGKRDVEAELGGSGVGL